MGDASCYHRAGHRDHHLQDTSPEEAASTEDLPSDPGRAEEGVGDIQNAGRIGGLAGNEDWSRDLGQKGQALEKAYWGQEH